MTRARDLARFVNNQALSIDGDLEVGINSSTPAARLDVRGNTIITGILTATTFSGALSGNATGLSGTPDITVNNIVAAGATFSGVLTYEDVTNVDSVGIVTARTGVEVTANGLVVNAGVSTFASDLSIADKIVHTGDTNTAIRFPAADTFTVETGGSEALRVDSSQRLILGATSAVDGGSTSLIQAASTGGARIILARNDTTTAQNDSLGRIRFYGNDSDGNYDECARLEVIADADHTSTSKASAITVHTTASGAESPTERLRITSTGGVHFNNAELIERVKITAGKLSDNTDIDLDDGMVHYFTTTETSAAIPNITSSIGINTSMATGDTMSVTIVTTAAAAAFAATFAIDHKQVGVTTFFGGGSSPTAGGSSGKDVTALTIVKTGDAAFDVLANISNFA